MKSYIKVIPSYNSYKKLCPIYNRVIAPARSGAIEPSYKSWRGGMYSRFWVQDSDEILAPA